MSIDLKYNSSITRYRVSQTLKPSRLATLVCIYKLLCPPKRKWAHKLLCDPRVIPLPPSFSWRPCWACTESTLLSCVSPFHHFLALHTPSFSAFLLLLHSCPCTGKRFWLTWAWEPRLRRNWLVVPWPLHLLTQNRKYGQVFWSHTCKTIPADRRRF